MAVPKKKIVVPRKKTTGNQPRSICAKCKVADPLFNLKFKCHQCNEDYHQECAEIADDVYQLFITGKLVGFTWSCMICRSGDGQVTRLNAIEENLEQSNSRNDEICAMISKLGEKLERVEELIKPSQSSSPILNNQNLPPQLPYVNNSITASSSDDIASSVAIDEEERKQREMKKMNLCLFNLPECESSDESVCYEEDMKKLKDVLFLKDGFNPAHVKRAYRVSREKTPGKIRPMVIVFNDQTTRMNVLKMNDLTYSQDCETVCLYTGIDKTKRQVNEHKLLVTELINRRNAGESDLIIRNGKIVKKRPFRPTPQSLWG